MRVIRYIKVEPGKGLLMSANTKSQLTGLCDADWAACPNTKRSVTCFILKFGDSLISWKSKNKIQCQEVLLKQNIGVWLP